MFFLKILLLIIGLEFQSVAPDFSPLESVAYLTDDVTSVTNAPANSDSTAISVVATSPSGAIAVAFLRIKLPLLQPAPLSWAALLPFAQGPPALS